MLTGTGHPAKHEDAGQRVLMGVAMCAGVMSYKRSFFIMFIDLLVIA
jgi:hypothetical protein